MATFEHTHTVRFSEVDQAGVVFFARYFEIAHTALESLFSSIGWGFDKLFNDGEWGFPLVHAESDFKRPARLGDVLTIQVSMSRLSDASFTVRYDVTNGDDQSVAMLSTAHVWVDLATFRKATIPTEVADKLRAYLVEG